MKELTLAATPQNIGAVTDFVNEQLEALSCPMKAQMQIDIAIDELFGNIAHYAYTPDVGEATVRVEIAENPLSVAITFIDSGMAFDPLAAADPDTTLPAQERAIGGLGIYMVKKSMDEIEYRYEDGKNILTIRKRIGS
ncbi:MAG: ATP-binding protein [Clostridia bacterium]|nr:ATP-binding protein [Clostridia bacterium]